ncbi:hypothetical protein EUBSIR_01206 [[Eubacterium] siraeum DSM 15702]|uniref:Uncharacterized protein n=1 Tax=[Eubacterium] siraeum DSM 15702 TaxID=428128 RepID=B0MMZ8_9FIRM|nr:hypothetical protein EUBSIR_01206 [[Eubacterium] siraeum DSM 15702]
MPYFSFLYLSFYFPFRTVCGGSDKLSYFILSHNSSEKSRALKHTQ